MRAEVGRTAARVVASEAGRVPAHLSGRGTGKTFVDHRRCEEANYGVCVELGQAIDF